MEVRVSRASAVVVQRVPVAAADWFLAWQHGITSAAEKFAGYRGTDVYPPTGAPEDEWVVVIHFDDEHVLQQWLNSTVRAEWLEKLRSRIGDFDLKTLPGGLGHWFAGLGRDAGVIPPSWKMALAVLFGLYPTVMLLTIYVGPYTSPLGLAVSMLIGNALSIALLQWMVMPALMTFLGPWLNANGAAKRSLSIGGLCLLLLVLAGLAILFRQVSG